MDIDYFMHHLMLDIKKARELTKCETPRIDYISIKLSIEEINAYKEQK